MNSSGQTAVYLSEDNRTLKQNKGDQKYVKEALPETLREGSAEEQTPAQAPSSQAPAPLFPLLTNDRVLVYDHPPATQPPSLGTTCTHALRIS